MVSGEFSLILSKEPLNYFSEVEIKNFHGLIIQELLKIYHLYFKIKFCYAPVQKLTLFEIKFSIGID